MTLRQIIPLLLVSSIVLTVFCFGLGVRRQDTRFLVRHPGRFAASFLSMHVLTPLVAVAFAAGFGLYPAVKVALITLAVSPVSPLLPSKELRAGGRLSYATGLFAASALLSVVMVPLVLQIVGVAAGDALFVPASAIAKPVLLTVLVPLLLGFAVRAFAPGFTETIANPVSQFARVTLVACAVPLYVVVWPSIARLIGNGTLLAVIVFAALALLIGHLLGGKEPEDRVVLALSTACRHPSVAVAAAGLVTPEVPLATAAILLYLLVSSVAASAYVRLVKGSHHAPSAQLAH